MNSDGQDLINIIIKRLKDEGSGHRFSDQSWKVRASNSAAILKKLREMNNAELNQAINFGDVQRWHNERIQRETSPNLPAEREKEIFEEKEIEEIFNAICQRVKPEVMKKIAEVKHPIDSEYKDTYCYCYNCGTNVKGQKFCHNCGYKFFL